MSQDWVLTTCPFCGTGCNFYLQVLDGEILDVVPCKGHPVSRGELCVLGRKSHQYVQKADRLTAPLIKKNGSFTEASWEEALRHVAGELSRIKEVTGPQSLGVLASAKCTNEENYLLMKLARGVLGTNSIDHCARLWHSSTVAGLAAAFGAGAMTNSIDEVQDTDAILVIGSNTTSQHPLIASRIIRAKHKGAKLVVVDPRRIPLVEYADLFIRPRPGTNVALLNGMVRAIIAKDLIDAEFIAAQTEGFEELKAKVAEYTPERVAEITGVDPDLLDRAAEIYGRADKAMILYAMGVTQQTAGTDNVKAVANLALATGNLGRYATGVNPLRGQNNVQGACDMGALPNVLTAYQKVADAKERERFAKAWSLPLPEAPGLTVGEMLQAAHRGELKGLYIVGENPMISDPDVSHVHKALQSLDLLVVQDIFMTETAQLADVVLPGASFAEKEGAFTNTDRRVQRVRQAIEPVGAAKPDWEIVCELAKQLGASGFDYANPSEVMEEIAAVTPSYGGITYERLDRGEVLQWPCPDTSHPGTTYLHASGFPKGKGTFHAVDHTPPAEAPDSEYPFILSTGRIPFHFHGGSMTRRIERLHREAPDAFVDIHPDSAKQLEVRQGEEVFVRSRRGEIVVKVRITDEVDPDVVFMPMHFPESPVNQLTDRRVDPVAKIPNLKVCAVNIHKPAAS